MKIGPIIKMTGLVLLACLSIAVIRYLDSATAPKTAVISKSTPALSPVISQDLSSLSLGTIAIQTFSGSTLVRSGSGSVISADGLIVTLAYVAPYGSGSYTYQVATSAGSLLRAKAVWRASGLVLLKVAANDLNAVSFDDEIPVTGAKLTAVGALTSTLRYIPIVLRADLAFTDQASDIALAFDRTYMSQLAGARIIEENGHSVGLVQPGTYGKLIPASVINTVIDQYLGQKK